MHHTQTQLLSSIWTEQALHALQIVKQKHCHIMVFSGTYPLEEGNTRRLRRPQQLATVVRHTTARHAQPVVVSA